MTHVTCVKHAGGCIVHMQPLTTQVDAKEMQKATVSKEHSPLLQSSGTSQGLQSSALPLIALGVCTAHRAHCLAWHVRHALLHGNAVKAHQLLLTQRKASDTPH